MPKDEKVANQRYNRAAAKSYQAEQAMGKQDAKVSDQQAEIEDLRQELKEMELDDSQDPRLKEVLRGKIAQVCTALYAETVELSTLKREFDKAEREHVHMRKLFYDDNARHLWHPCVHQ